MSPDALYFVLRSTIGAVALWAALEKLRDPEAFTRGVRRYRLIPQRFAPLVASTVIATELVIGTLLVLDRWPLFAAGAAAGLFALFSGAIVVNLLRGNRVPCECFGSSERESLSWASAARALLLLVVATGLMWLTTVRPGPPTLAMIPPSLTITAGAVLALRLTSLVPQALSSLTARAVISPTGRHRISLRNVALDASLRILASGDLTGASSLRGSQDSTTGAVTSD
jgi:uncharacterized membrane protein YphA (DoxX/SURF4 family)